MQPGGGRHSWLGLPHPGHERKKIGEVGRLAALGRDLSWKGEEFRKVSSKRSGQEEASPVPPGPVASGLEFYVREGPPRQPRLAGTTRWKEVGQDCWDYFTIATVSFVVRAESFTVPRRPAAPGLIKGWSGK